MRVIYEPKGAAKEYSSLAANTYMTCPHQCQYCYSPNIVHMNREEFHKEARLRKDSFAADFRHDCETMKKNGDTRRVHLNFLSDPYPDCEGELHITRRCIEVAAENDVGIQILTKGKYVTVRPDFGLFKRARVHFGITNCFVSDATRTLWEPFASSLSDRFALLREAHAMGIFTWVSMEPVIDPEEAIEFFRQFHGIVDLWKVGKLNYHPHAKTIDWMKFREDFKTIADKFHANYIIKKSLLEVK